MLSDITFTHYEEDDAMDSAVTPSANGLTDGQIDKLCDVFRAQLRKRRSELPSEAVQQVLGQPELGTELLQVLRNRVEAISKQIVRRVRPNRQLTPQAVLDATGRRQYTDKGVVNAMPHGEDEEVDVYFFKVGRGINDADLEKEFALRGLMPVDPYALAQVNTDDPAFVDERPNGTHWKDADGRWCYATFGRWDGERGVYVGRNDGQWFGGWWFAGVRK